MKASIRTRAGHVLQTSEVENEKDLFRAVAKLQEIFSSDDACGSCNSQDIAYRVRKHDTFEYFELACNACTARLAFGQSKAGSLFPKRKDDDGNPLPNRGWQVWRALPAESHVTAGVVSQPRARNTGHS